MESGYRLLLGDLMRVEWDKIVWSKFNTPKYIFVLWLAIHNRMSTKERIKKYIDLPNSDCILCEEAEEYVHHLFFFFEMQNLHPLSRSNKGMDRLAVKRYLFA